ncbi:helix-turn-helix domain-containing protein [bacterium]|nr:helix-turn-helix domain-containing protein [bacterium]
MVGERMMRESEVAALLGVSRRTLQGWRWRGGGPPYVRIGGAVRYEPAEVRAWLDAQRRTSTSDSGGEVSR